MADEQTGVLVAGIGGASLGTEVLKALSLAGRYRVYGCDISPYAAGHYFPGPLETFVVKRENYVEDVLALCRRLSVSVVVPGGEEPAILLSAAAERFADNNVRLACNTPEVVALCSDKARLFSFLKDKGVAIPESLEINDPSDLHGFPCPCVIKPSRGSGGSSFVFLAGDGKEAVLYAAYLLENGVPAMAQEYLGEEEGEYTIGVLSLPGGTVAGSVCLRRMFHVKLSYVQKTKTGVISSGYSQGLVKDFPDIRRQAEDLARLVGSRGPLNIQARLKGGVLHPFEINPRFSTTTYLRAMAGFNEVDAFIQHLLTGKPPEPFAVLPGYYLRSLDEVRVPLEDVKNAP
ncbi:MAG: ATP-grasp domain-containing protein [Deltaproteobacteria bacterium]|nr:ATP-grasp domain-containing protein [Deltaproteobacteria bacterium]